MLPTQQQQQQQQAVFEPQIEWNEWPNEFQTVSSSGVSYADLLDPWTNPTNIFEILNTCSLTDKYPAGPTEQHWSPPPTTSFRDRETLVRSILGPSIELYYGEDGITFDSTIPALETRPELNWYLGLEHDGTGFKDSLNELHHITPRLVQEISQSPLSPSDGGSHRPGKGSEREYLSSGSNYETSGSENLDENPQWATGYFGLSLSTDVQSTVLDRDKYCSSVRVFSI